MYCKHWLNSGKWQACRLTNEYETCYGDTTRCHCKAELARHNKKVVDERNKMELPVANKGE